MKERSRTLTPARVRPSTAPTRRIIAVTATVLLGVGAMMFAGRRTTAPAGALDGSARAWLEGRDGPAPSARAYLHRTQPEIERALGAPISYSSRPSKGWRMYRRGKYLIYIHFAADGSSSAVQVIHLTTRTVVEMVSQSSWGKFGRGFGAWNL